MTAPKKEKLINLLPKEEFAESTLGRALTWALSTFRIIVIVTELIVVCAFLSRFWLDAKITDLNDQIKQKSSIISSFSPLEKKFRQVQIKLSVFSTLTSNGQLVSKTIKTVYSYLPPDVFLNSFSYKDRGSNINATTLSEQSISQLIANLDSLGLFSKISLDQVNSQKNKASLNFNLTVTLK